MFFPLLLKALVFLLRDLADTKVVATDSRETFMISNSLANGNNWRRCSEGTADRERDCGMSSKTRSGGECCVGDVWWYSAVDKLLANIIQRLRLRATLHLFGAAHSLPFHLLGSPNQGARKMLPFLQNALIDFWRACIEIYGSPLALPLLLAFLWRARSMSKTDILQLILPAILVSYVVALFFPSNAQFFSFQRKWYEWKLEDISSSAVLTELVHSWHLEEHFLSDKASTMALIFYLQMLIGEVSGGVWYKKSLQAIGSLAALMLFSSLMLLLIVSAGTSTMFPSAKELDSMSLEAGEAALKRAWEWSMGLPIWAGATAMLDLLASVAVYQWLKARELKIPQSAIILYVVCPSIILTFALISIATLSVTKGVLWLVFVVVAYAPLLAATRAGIREDRSLLAFYRRGVKSIVVGGQT